VMNIGCELFADQAQKPPMCFYPEEEVGIPIRVCRNVGIESSEKPWRQKNGNKWRTTAL
jgi:hypothetical protein